MSLHLTYVLGGHGRAVPLWQSCWNKDCMESGFISIANLLSCRNPCGAESTVWDMCHIKAHRSTCDGLSNHTLCNYDATQPFTSNSKKYILPTFQRETCTCVATIGSTIILNLSKLWRATFFILFDVRFLVKFEIENWSGNLKLDHSWEWKGKQLSDYPEKIWALTAGIKGLPSKRQLSFLLMAFHCPDELLLEDLVFYHSCRRSPSGFL